VEAVCELLQFNDVISVVVFPNRGVVVAICELLQFNDVINVVVFLIRVFCGGNL
jgi:hypothetical protein